SPTATRELNNMRLAIAIGLLAMFNSTSSAQVPAVRAGSPEYSQMLHELRLAGQLERDRQGQYFDQLSELWQNESFDKRANPKAEYERLAGLFKASYLKHVDSELSSAKDRLQAIRRGNIRRAVPRPVVEDDGKFFFNH